MKILLINGSPHPKGTSAVLVDEFVKGACEKNHQVDIFHAARESVHPCIGCDKCLTQGKGCIYKDGMEQLNPLLVQTDLIVFVTPLYYFGMSTQLKSVIDRFYANNTTLRTLHKKAAILATCGDQDDWAFDALNLHYQTICKYLNWTSIGGVFAQGVYLRQDIIASGYPQRAYEFGLHL